MPIDLEKPVVCQFLYQYTYNKSHDDTLILFRYFQITRQSGEVVDVRKYLNLQTEMQLRDSDDVVVYQEYRDYPPQIRSHYCMITKTRYNQLNINYCFPDPFTCKQ